MAPVVAMTGFMGSGKTKVGRALARRLGWRFTDLDDEIERRSGRAVAEWFRDDGESGFRAIETHVLAVVLDEGTNGEGGGLVLALGGGTVTIADSLSLLRGRAFVVYLAVEPQVAWERVRGSGRPLATDEDTFVALAQTRRSAYLAAADAVVECGGRSVAELAAEVAAVLGERGAAA